jgi:uncharacterized protein
MGLQVTSVMLGVEDLERSKAFYEAMGCKVDKDYPTFVELVLGDGPPSLALYPRDAAAQDAGVSPDGSGFRVTSFHFIVDSNDAVDDVISTAAHAGGAIVKAAGASAWGGYFGYFSDPDGHLWKVAAAA